ncbi:MAG: hypothetical protein O2897_05250 [bacterium]|nr:hypothetical protein [bacterium]
MIDEIIKHKRIEVKLREQKIPLASFITLVKPTDRSLAAALKGAGPGFIFECKKASPSQGLLRADFNIEAIVKSYASFASAISVLTDTKYFAGELAYLEQVRALVDCPILCKDFIVSTYQIYESRKFGADAVLLMFNVLSDCRYAKN